MITAAGVGSGIDIESILSQLDQVERRPVNVLNSKRAALDVELSAYGTVKGALSALNTAAKTLGSDNDFGAYEAFSSNDDIFTATSTGGDIAQFLDIEVLSLATNHRLSSAALPSAQSAVPEGTWGFSAGDNDFEVDLGPSTATLEGLADAINNSVTNTSMSASIVNVDGGSRMILTAKETGADNQISMNQPGLILNNINFDEVTGPRDAQITVHGFTVTNSSNMITGAIDGVTLNLKGVGEATVNTERNTESLRSSLNEFVTKYNALSDTMSNLSQNQLQGDSLPRGIENRMRDVFFNSIELGNGDSSTALGLGFTFDRNGKLSLDETKLDSALEQGVNRYVDMFNSTDGLSSKFSTLIEEYTKTGGIIDTREDGVGTRQSSIDNQIDRLEYRLDKASDRLRRQFTAMDLIVTNLQSTSSFLTSRLSNDNF
ncbi:MAG: flagellar hook-associated protein 2 [bacterium]|jgi:flagellar hook-associated protein 2